MGLFGAGDPPCPAGSICSGQAKTDVGKKTRAVGGTRTQILDKGTPIYHASATKLNSDGTSTTDVYIIKDNKWQKAATTKDGGKTYTYDDNVAGAGLKNELSDPNGAIHKNVDAGVNKAADKAGVPPTTKSNLLDSKKNDAENDNDNAQTKPAAPIAGDGIKGLTNATEESSDGTRTEFPTLVHPTGLGKSKQDVIRFDMMEYMPQEFINASTGSLGFSNAGRQDMRSRSIGSVTLPIPSGISDQNQADWGSQSMTALDIAKADVALSTLNAAANNTGAGKAFADAGSSYIEFLKRSGGAANMAIANAFAAAAAGVEGQQLLARTTGMVMNPNMELLFKGPTLRPFSFKFTLSPRDKDEARTIISIIRFFKQGMAPIRSKSNLFLKTPHTFQLRYLHRGEKEDGGTGLHFKLNAFKECALQSFGVNYTPTGNYATYQDGTMVSYEITMGFSELEPVFNDDYGMGNGSDPDDAIGF